MHMRRVHLTMRSEGITAFSNRYGVVVWTGENDTKTIRTQIFFLKRSKTAPFSFENGLVWTGPNSRFSIPYVNIELPCVIIALALEEWPSLGQSICYVITLLRALFCKQCFSQSNCYVVTLLRALFCIKQCFFNRTVTLLRYYKRFSINSIFFSRTVTLLRYYERFSINSIFFFSWTVTLLRYYERFSVNRIFLSVDLLRCYAITSAFTLLYYYEHFSVNSIFISRSSRCYAIVRALLTSIFSVDLLRYCERFSYYAITSAFL